jgi:hypothetical protein
MAVNHFPMHSSRALVAGDPRQFGRAPAWQSPTAGEARHWRLSDDAQLFAATFAAGFLFVSILIG